MDKYCAARTDLETFAGTPNKFPSAPAPTILFSNASPRHAKLVMAISDENQKGMEHARSMKRREWVDWGRRSGSPPSLLLLLLLMVEG